jgi:hypothetical protein
VAQNPVYDKYEPISGGFRGLLAADLTFSASGSFGPKGVSLDVNGKVVVGGAGNSGYVGVMVKNVPLYPNLGNVAGAVNINVPVGGKAGQPVDIMTDGEIVGVTGLVAGTTYFLDATGNITATGPGAGVNGYRVGHTVEATRLVVRFERVQG